MPGEKLTNVIDMFGIIQAPGVNFLALTVKHSVHHRGQLSTYLRPMGSKVPGSTGLPVTLHSVATKPNYPRGQSTLEKGGRKV
jgi:uncharacterized damage-inducible protein DinB